jgi:xylulokinase
VLCDDDLRPLRPAILYGIDTRATAEIELLREELGAQKINDRAGTLLSSQAVGPKLEWVYRHEPEVFERATGFYGSNSYVTAKLTGEYIQDHHTASQSDPLYLTREFDWNKQWAQRICRHLALPRLVWPGEVVGTVHADAAETTYSTRHARGRGYRRRVFGSVLGESVIRASMLMYGSDVSRQIINEYYSDPACGRPPASNLARWRWRGTSGRGRPDQSGCRRSPATHRSSSWRRDPCHRAPTDC